MQHPPRLIRFTNQTWSDVVDFFCHLAVRDAILELPGRPPDASRDAFCSRPDVQKVRLWEHFCLISEFAGRRKHSKSAVRVIMFSMSPFSLPAVSEPPKIALEGCPERPRRLPRALRELPKPLRSVPERPLEHSRNAFGASDVSNRTRRAPNDPFGAQKAASGGPRDVISATQSVRKSDPQR